jgi:hypothetical protein
MFTMGGLTFLQPGDTLLAEQHLKLTAADVLFISPTEHNMRVDHSALLINAIEPAFIFPQHFDTYVPTEENSYWTVGYPDELKAALSAEMQKRFHKLEQGQVFVIA